MNDMLWKFTGVIYCPPYGELPVNEICTMAEFWNDMPPGARFYGGSSSWWAGVERP